MRQSIADRYDVLVVGGGPAGICAAAQAARAGASTLLVEKNGVLGGTAVVAGVAFPGLFHAYGRQVIAGIGWDLVRRTVDAVAPGDMPDFTLDYGQAHWRHHVRINMAVFAALADQVVLEAGADLLFHAMLAGVNAAPPGWDATLCLKEGLRRVRSDVLIDCTGDANAVLLAGLPVERSDTMQAATLMLHADGYRLEDLDIEAVERAAVQAIAAGELLASDLGRRASDRPCWNFLHAAGHNRMHVPSVDASGSIGRTEMELRSRQSMLRLFRFFRSQPGLERFHYRWFALECGIRQTVTIRGKRRITLADYTSGRHWDDAVCYSFYPVDVHQPDGLGVDIRPLARGVYPTIPRGAMLPEGSGNLIVAGRHIAGDAQANSAYRTQPTCMAAGQAAGGLAALAARTGRDPSQVPMSDLYDVLRAAGAIVPGQLPPQ